MDMDVFQVTVSNRSYPPDTGGYQRIHGLTSNFDTDKVNVERYCCTGVLATLYSEGTLIDRKIQPAKNVLEHRNYSFWHDIPKIISEIGFSRIFWEYFFRFDIRNRIINKSENFDVVIGEDPYTAALLARETDLPTVYSSHNVEYLRYKETHNGPYVDKISKMIKTVEKRACEQSDLVICTTKEDKDEFSQYSDSVVRLHNGIPQSRFTESITDGAEADIDLPEGQNAAVFIGSNYYPNVEAAQWLINNWEAVDNCHLFLIGHMANAVETNKDRVHTVGFVDNLESWLDIADVTLNPVRLGGGSNIKLLDYFAAKTPVVSTPFGASGFDISDGKQLLIRERSNFLEGIQEILADEQLQKQLTDEAFQTVRRNYTWEQLSKIYEEYLLELADISP